VLTEKEKEQITGDYTETATPFMIHDVEKDYTFIHSAAKEHIKMCLACAQRAMRHHAGVGNPLDEEGIKIGVAYVSQISEHSTIILEQVQRVLIEHEKQIREMSNTVNKITDLVEKNMLSNSQVLSELKDTIKKDLKRFYQVVSVVAVPLMIGASFLINAFAN